LEEAVPVATWPEPSSGTAVVAVEIFKAVAVYLLLALQLPLDREGSKAPVLLELRQHSLEQVLRRLLQQEAAPLQETSRVEAVEMETLDLLEEVFPEEAEAVFLEQLPT
jgi:hypothetical protein